MAYTIWRRTHGSQQWVFTGLQLDSEKLAEQAFAMYKLAGGERIQLRDADGIIIDERMDQTRPHSPSQ